MTHICFSKPIALLLTCFTLTAFTVTACSSTDIEEPIIFTRAAPQTDAEIDFAKEVLNGLQEISISENREYCGYIGIDPSGDYIHSAFERGRKGSCVTKAIADDFTPVASLHTHGAFSEKYDSETPSQDDLLSDINEGLDGYIATPGGRVWFNDARAQTAIMLCGLGCITSDIDYKDEPDYPVAPRYTLEQLQDLEK